MKSYCVDKQPQENGEHAVHEIEGACPAMPNVMERETLGTHPNPEAAVSCAKTLFFKESKACKWCLPDNHTS